VNVVKVKLFGVGFLGIILGKIFLVSEFFLAVKRVRVNGNFRVRAENTLVICKNEGVDFNHVTIFFPEARVQLLKEVDDLVFMFNEVKLSGSFLE